MSVTITVNENNFYTELADKIKNELETKVITLSPPNPPVVWSDSGYQLVENGPFYDYSYTVRQQLTAVKCEFSNVSVTASSYGINISYTVNYTPITESL